MPTPKIVLHENQHTKLNPSLKYVVKSVQDSIRKAICNNVDHLTYPNKLEVEFNFTEVMKVVKQDICCKYYFDEIKKNSQGRIHDSYLGQIDQNQS